MKKSIFLTIIAFVLYFLQSLIRGIFVGTMHTNEVVAELVSVLSVLFIVFLMISKKDALSYYGIRCLEGRNSIKIAGLPFLFPLINIPYLFVEAELNIVFIIISSIFVGIMEELIFRAFLCRSIEEKLGKNRAIILSSLIFGVFHLVNIGSYENVYILLQVIYAFAFGIVFATVFYKTQSIVCCMIVHSIVDILGSFGTEPILAVEIIGTIIACSYAAYYYFFIAKDNWDVQIK